VISSEISLNRLNCQIKFGLRPDIWSDQKERLSSLEMQIRSQTRNWFKYQV